MSFVSKGNTKISQQPKKNTQSTTSLNIPSKQLGRSNSTMKLNSKTVNCAICSKRPVEVVSPTVLGCGHSICKICADLVSSNIADLKKKFCPDCVTKPHKLEAEMTHLQAKGGAGGLAGLQDYNSIAEHGATWDEASSASSGDEKPPQGGVQIGYQACETQTLCTDTMNQSNDSREICGIHSQEYSGFCMSCRRLVCVDCLFTSHKSHDFHPVRKARELAQSTLARHKVHAEGVRDSMAAKLTTVRKIASGIDEAEASKLAEVKAVMNQIRRQLMLREQKLEESVRLEFQKHREATAESLQVTHKNLAKLDSIVAALNNSNNHRDIKLLGRV